MQITGRCALLCGLVAVFTICGAGCVSHINTGGNVDCGKRTRLLEEENFRLGKQIEDLQKDLAELKAARVAEQKEWAEQEKAADSTITFMMQQLEEKDAEINKLRESAGKSQ